MSALRCWTTVSWLNRSGRRRLPAGDGDTGCTAVSTCWRRSCSMAGLLAEHDTGGAGWGCGGKREKTPDSGLQKSNLHCRRAEGNEAATEEDGNHCLGRRGEQRATAGGGARRWGRGQGRRDQIGRRRRRVRKETEDSEFGRENNEG